MTLKTMILPQQLRALGIKNLTTYQGWVLDEIDHWQHHERGQVLQVMGPAGTAKSTIAALVLAGFPDSIGLCFQAKAASVLRRKGAQNVSTLHSLLYGSPIGFEEVDGRENPVFELKNRHEQYPFVVVDEGSQIDARLGRDLLSRSDRVLVFNDSIQLPPIDGAPFFSLKKFSDWIELTEIHRQSSGSDVLQLATDIREGRRIRLRDEYNTAALLAADIIICATHSTRRQHNDFVRKHRYGRGWQRKHLPPIEDERVICMRNDYANKVWNGTIWKVTKSTVHGDVATLELFDEFDGERRVTVPLSCFEQDITPTQAWDVPRGLTAMTWAYAVTAHKAQGSEWDHVAVLDETSDGLMSYMAGRMSPERFRLTWRYVAVSRARTKVSFIEFDGPR